MPDGLLAAAARAVESARAAGAADAFATLTRRRVVENRHRDDALERVEESTSLRLTLRLYVDGRYSTHVTSDLEPGRLTAFTREAVAMTRLLDVDPDRVITDPALYAGRPEGDLELLDRRVLGLDAAARARLVRAAAEAGRADDRVVSVTATATDTHVRTGAASSNGFAGTDEWSTVRLATHVTLRDRGDLRPDGWFGAGTVHLGDLPAPEEVGRRALERAVARLGSTQGATRRTAIVVEPEQAGRLIARLLAPATAEAVSQERSYFRNRVGEALFSPLLTVTDDPLVPRGLGSRPFDAEGIAARRLPLVEAGRVAGLYVDTYYGRKIGAAPTTGSPSNVVLSPGEHDLAALVAEAGQGVLVTSWIGGNTDPTTGEFSFGIRGQMIEDGAVGAPVGEMNVSGHILELFQRLRAVGSDPWPYSSFRVPTLVFDDVQLSGA